MKDYSGGDDPGWWLKGKLRGSCVGSVSKEGRVVGQGRQDSCAVDMCLEAQLGCDRESAGSGVLADREERAWSDRSAHPRRQENASGLEQRGRSSDVPPA